MKSYNNFSAAQRNRAGAWLRDQWLRGTLQRPSVCCACGQDKGVIDAHAEDYSEPFRAGVTDQYHLCYRCHLALHCRFNNPQAWETYKRHIREGRIFHPIGRSFHLFTVETLNKMGEGVPYTQGAPKDRTFLDDL